MARFSERSTDVLTVAQVATYLQLNKLTVYKYIREGRIPAAKLGRAYRIRKTDVDLFLNSQMLRRQRKTTAGTAMKFRQEANLAEVQAARAEIGLLFPWREPRELRYGDLVIPPLEWFMRGLR